jgi:hypothetical protein
MSPSAIADTAAGERIFRTRPQQLAACHFAAMPILEMKEHGWAVIRERVGNYAELSLPPMLLLPSVEEAKTIGAMVRNLRCGWYPCCDCSVRFNVPLS